MKGTSTNDSKLQLTKRGLLEEDKEEENLAETDALKPKEKNPNFKGDENLINDESKWLLNTWNTLLFAGAILLAALFTGFCCVYTVKFYTQGLLIMVLIIILIALLIENVILRPLVILILSLTFCCWWRCAKDYWLWIKEEEEKPIN